MANAPVPQPDRQASLVRLNARRALGADLYHSLIGLTWPRLIAAIVGIYLVTNCLFALAYMACGRGVANARPGYFLDAFFFSVQTMSTIGYGQMAPVSLAAHVTVTLEALTALLGVAMATGLMFSKFSRPTARVLFSRVAVVSSRDGTPSLMFRMANERANQIVEAQLHVAVAKNETTAEGESVRRFYDLPLTRNQTALFNLTWTAIYPIRDDSPFAKESFESLREKGASIIVSLMGFDETFSQTVHARHTYSIENVRWGERLADILSELPDGRRSIDYGKFHETVPAPVAAREPPTGT